MVFLIVDGLEKCSRKIPAGCARKIVYGAQSIKIQVLEQATILPAELHPNKLHARAPVSMMGRSRERKVVLTRNKTLRISIFCPELFSDYCMVVCHFVESLEPNSRVDPAE